MSLAVLLEVHKEPALQPGIDMARPPTFRRITSDIEEIAFVMAFWTDLRGSGRCDGVSTAVALPVGQAATWTNIPDEFA
jgi:hypothetical protein